MFCPSSVWGKWKEMLLQCSTYTVTHLSSKWVKQRSHNNNILCTNFAISASVTLLNSIRAWNWPESQHKPFVSSFTTSLNCRVCNRKSSGVTIGCQCSFTSTETKFSAPNFSRTLTIFGEGDDSQDCPKTGENLSRKKKKQDHIDIMCSMITFQQEQQLVSHNGEKL